MKEVMKYLDKFNLTYKTYSFITDTDHSSFIPDYNIIESSKRGLLPWKDNPKKKYS